MRLGIIGLGQSGAMIIDEVSAAPDLPWTIAAGADPREHARKRFADEFGSAYADAAELCGAADVDAVYIASPSWICISSMRRPLRRPTASTSSARSR